MGQDVPVALKSSTDIMRSFVKSRIKLLAMLNILMIVGLKLDSTWVKGSNVQRSTKVTSTERHSLRVI